MAKRDEHSALIFQEMEASEEFSDALARVAGYTLPDDLESIFRKLHLGYHSAYMNPTIIRTLEPPETWAKVRDRITEIYQSVSAMHYHLDNVTHIEQQVDLLITQYAEHTRMARDGAFWNIHFTNKFTFEYHAFTYVSIRCLTYLSLGVGRLIGKTCRTLKSLSENLNDEEHLNRLYRDHHGTKALRQVISTHTPSLIGMISNRAKNRDSIRDWIAHNAFLPAGALRITGGQTKLVGVLKASTNGMNTDAQDIYRLSHLMNCQLEQVVTFVREIMSVLEGHFLPRVS